MVVEPVETVFPNIFSLTKNLHFNITNTGFLYLKNIRNTIRFLLFYFPFIIFIYIFKNYTIFLIKQLCFFIISDL